MRCVLGGLNAYFGLVIGISSTDPWRHLCFFMTVIISLYETVASYVKQSDIASL